MKSSDILPITFNTHNRTKCACYCIRHLFQNVVFDGQIHFYVCDDRSDEGHLEQIEQTLKDCGCNNYTVIQSNSEHWGYGYVLNAALDQAFKKNDVVLTLEDDRLLEHTFDFTPLVNWLKGHMEYFGMRVSNNDRCFNEKGMFENNSDFCIYDFTNEKFRYNLQCMLRTKTAFQAYRFLENCHPQKVEHFFMEMKLPVVQAMRSHKGNYSQIFRHIGMDGLHKKMVSESAYGFLFNQDCKISRLTKLNDLRGKAKRGTPIKVGFYSNDIWDNSKIRASELVAPKDKTRTLMQYLQSDGHFQVIPFDQINETVVEDVDLVVPPMQYGPETFFNNSYIRNHLTRNMKLVNVRYTLAWHKILQRKDYNNTYINCEDAKDICTQPNDIFTGHPYSEYLNLPKESFANPWKDSSKKHIILSFHHSIVGNNRYRNHSSFLKCAKMVCDFVNKWKDKVEFIWRPHPDMYYRFKQGKIKNEYVVKLFNELMLSMENDYVPLMKWSDAMIHDCGSFRCEYLYMDKPVCYMANDVNMDPKIWSQMGKDAIDCHELCWTEKGETLDKFIENVVNGNDVKKEIRKEYIEKYCLNYPNGKTPCENIVNAILGQKEYKQIFTTTTL